MNFPPLGPDPALAPGRWIWVGYLDPAEDPHRAAFLVALDAGLRECGQRLDVRRLNRVGPDRLGDAPVGRLRGAGRGPGEAWFRARHAPRGAGHLGAVGHARGGSAFAAARGLWPWSGRARAAAVAAALVDAIDNNHSGDKNRSGAGPAAGLLLWNQFADVSVVAAELGARRGLPVRFVHEGVLPGSVGIEAGGQMADGELARAAAEPRWAAAPSAADRDATERFLATVRGARMTRKKQGDGAATAAAIEAVPGPKLFYAGQNDEAAGFVPRSLPRARHHSPAFASTLDALGALQARARADGFRLVFKPHPLWRRRHGDRVVRAAIDPAVTTFLPEADLVTAIERTDATATILSQAAYHARIHQKPALLLGRMPMTGWGCCVEHPRREGLGPAIAQAIAGGPDGADEAFVRHATVARMHFLLPYDPAVSGWFPRRVRAAAADLAAAAASRGPG